MLVNSTRNRRCEGQHILTRDLAWMIDQLLVHGNEIECSGWAFSDRPEKCSFAIDGDWVASQEYPLASEDLRGFFDCLPQAARCRFRYRGTLDPQALEDGSNLHRLEFIDPSQGKRQPWYLCRTVAEPPLPARGEMQRVVNVVEDFFFQLGGATVAGRVIADYLKRATAANSGRPIRVLDWGCGAGRVSAYLLVESRTRRGLEGLEVHGTDIDAVNVAATSNRLLDGSFTTCNLQPPLPYPDGFFDLVIGVSVLTHLREDDQFRWLEELRRVTAPNALLYLTYQGVIIAALQEAPESLLCQVMKQGFVITGENRQLAVADDAGAYYVDVYHSEHYVTKQWGRFFELLDIRPGMGLHQDVAVLQR